MRKKLPPVLLKFIKEIPIIAFFIYLAYLCVLFHNRNHMMLDYPLTFDHCWYFYHRLRQGFFAQWNPYSLLGRIAVQWNYIPVSVIFSPFLMLSELTLEKFHYYQIISTFMSISVIYLTGRMLKYNRFYCLIPIILLVGSGYRYWAAFMKFASFLVLYPLSIVALLSAFNNHGRAFWQKWFAFVILLSLSFTGFRMEKIVYALTFILLIFFIRGIYHYGSRKRLLQFFGLGILSVLTAVAANAWHLSLLVNSTAENYRLAGSAFNPQKVFDPLFLKWTLVSVIQQPALILVCLNLLFLGIYRSKPKLSSRDVSIRTAFAFIVIELALIKLISLLPWTMGVGELLTDTYARWNLHKINIIYSWSGIISIILSALAYFSIQKKVTRKQLFSYLAVVFAGFYIAEYSWGLWPLNQNRHYFFMPPVFAGFIPLGAVHLLIKKKTWLISVLVAYHFIGETVSFFLFEVIGMPWSAPRAALMEIPFQIILMLETLTLLIRVPSGIIRQTFNKAVNLLPIIAKTGCLIFAFLSIKLFLMPVDNGKEKYLEDFPFAETKIHEPERNINQTIYAAYKNSTLVREKYAKESNPFQRVRIPDEILSFGPQMGYKFMPAYSQTLNTAPVYSSEIPKTMKNIFSNTPGKEEENFLRYHPEMNPVFFAYKESAWDKTKGQISKLYDYINQTTILPHQNNNPVFKEIMAEQGSSTQRAFLTSKVIKFNTPADEYTYLSNVLMNKGRLDEQITTSDNRYTEQAQKDDNTALLKYKLRFEQDSPEHIIFRLSANKDAYLALMDLWSKGWRAYTDGKETPVYRGYIGTRFIEIKGGEHIVEFKYTVPGFIPASITSILTWLALLLAMIKLNRKGPLNAKNQLG